MKRLAELCQELGSTASVTPSGRPHMEDGRAQGSDGMETFGRVVVKQRNLVEERDELILAIQDRPTFQGFLATPSFNTPHTSVSHCPSFL
jgi:hypothetical protein